jgi:energy-coupling factor transporter ATP-binding protein EcfA2
MSALPDDYREPIVLEWDEFDAMFADAHKQGEHVAIVGPNGSGKTKLGLRLCKIIGRRPAKNGRPTSVTVLQYKPRDDTLGDEIADWPIIKKWPPKYGEEHCVIWPKTKTASGAARLHRAVFAPVLDRIYVEGGQTVYIPEAAYFERAQPAGLGLGGTMEQFWGTARSLKLTVISDTQRPRKVTILMWTEPAWVFIYKVKNRDDLKHLIDLTGEQSLWQIVPRLGEHEFVCIRQQRHKGQEELYVSKVAVVTRNNRNSNPEREGK